MANVSRRTIDYYTSIGLLVAERSKSNYRIYTHQALEDLKFIEECKKLHIPLEEIKSKLEIKKLEDIEDEELRKHIESVTQQMKQLQMDISILLPLIENLNEGKAKDYSNILNTEGNDLIKSLSVLTS